MYHTRKGSHVINTGNTRRVCVALPEGHHSHRQRQILLRLIQKQGRTLFSVHVFRADEYNQQMRESSKLHFVLNNIG